MTLSGRFLRLWSRRIIFINTFLIILSDLSPQPFWSFFVLIILNVFLSVFLFLKYKSFCLELGAGSVTIKSGFFFSKTLRIKYSSLCAVRAITTPLAKYLHLQNPVLYCEGVTFLLPALDNNFIRKLQTHLDIEEENSP